MFKSFFKITLRSLWKNKFINVIHILGLTIGISSFLVIYLVFNYHFSFDKFEKDSQRIYRIVSILGFSGVPYYNPGVPSPMSIAIRKELANIDDVMKFKTWDGEAKISVQAPGKNDFISYKHQGNIIFADSAFIEMPGYRWLAGSPATSLSRAYQTVLTASGAKQLFPKLRIDEIIGQKLYLNDTVRTTVSGIIDDIKENTDFTFQLFVSYSTLESITREQSELNNWSIINPTSQVYVKITQGKSPLVIENQLLKLYEKYHYKNAEDRSTVKFVLQPLKELHFSADYDSYAIPRANKTILYSLLLVATFLLALGCINFVNLTTAYSTKRAKEIAIRKTMGSSRSQLIAQSLCETLLLTIVATGLSILLVPFILTVFSDFIPTGLHLSLMQQPNLVIFIPMIIVLVSLLSGFYPAIILSGYKPAHALKNQLSMISPQKVWLRKSLTIFQFIVAQAFIMMTILVSNQTTYSLNKDMGFKKDAILYFPTNSTDTLKSRRYVLMNRLKTIPGITLVSLSSNAPSSNRIWASSLNYRDGKKEIETDVQFKIADTNFIKLYQLKLLAGNNIMKSDTSNQFLINETYLRNLGFQDPRQAIGKYLYWDNIPIVISGVVADFNQRSTHESAKPMVIANGDYGASTMNIALGADNQSWNRIVEQIKKEFKAVYPDDDFEYKFFNDDIAKYYQQEKNMSLLLNWASGLAIFISCLGLLGLVAYTCVLRTREIGVRKVLGATVSQLFVLMSKDFIGLILFAFIVAAPLAWTVMYKWLQNFAYRTEISWWIFLAGGSLMMVIATITIFFETIKTAMINPVKSLRTE